MKVERRWKKIEDLLKENGSLSIQELAARLNISDTTVRRDLVKMEKNDMINRLWGGASAKDIDISDNQQAHFQDDYILKFSRNIPEKEKIARYAATLIKDNQTVFLDAGSTTSLVIDFITAKDIILITNSVNSFYKLAQKNITTYVPHGVVNFGSAAILGKDTVEKLCDFNYDIALFGTNGIDELAGYTSRNDYDADIKKEIIKRSTQTFVLSDNTKFNIKKLYTFSALESCTLITNSKPPEFIKSFVIAE